MENEIEKIESFEEIIPALVPKARKLGMLTLRDYQHEAADCVFEGWTEHQALMIVMATGTGKTVVASEVICRWAGEGRILFIAHMKELIYQAVERISAHIVEIPSIEMGKFSEDQEGHPILDKSQVLVASIQTLVRRYAKFNPKDFDLIIIDEFHHCHVQGSLISTRNELKAIETIQVGDSVTSWNGDGFSEKLVTNTFCYWYDGSIIDITTVDGMVSVTPNHKMYSHGTKIYASSIRKGDSISMPNLRLDNRQSLCDSDAPSLAPFRQETLPKMPFGYECCGSGIAHRGPQARRNYLSALRQIIQQNSHWWPYQHKTLRQSCCDQSMSQTSDADALSQSKLSQVPVGTDESQEPDEQSRFKVQGTNIHHSVDPAGNNDTLWKSSSVRKWRQTNELGDRDAPAVQRCSIQLVGYSAGWTETLSLQNRPGLARCKGRVGDRRIITPIQESSRCQERRAPVTDRLENGQNIECRRRLRESRVIAVRTRHYTGFVFDIEVADTHNYIANGLLSSNSAAISYRKIWDYFKNGNPQIKLLGMTATPNRTDKISLKCLADHCVYEMGIRTSIDEGWLTPIKQRYIVIDGLDFSKCRTIAKDFNEKDLEETMMGGIINDGLSDEERQAIIEKQERMLHAVAAPTIEEAKGKSGIVYCVTVDHAVRMAEVLRRYPSVTAEVIHGELNDDSRRDAIRDFKIGKIQFLCVIGCCNEGFDAAAIEVVAMARPTKSQLLYTQIIGRALRPLPGIIDVCEGAEARQAAIAGSIKPWSSILDFVGNSGKHKLISTADVLAGDMPVKYVEAAIDDMKRTGETKDIRQAVWDKKEQYDAETRRRQEEIRRQEEDRRKKAQAIEEARRARIIAEADYRIKEIDPFGYTAAPTRVQSAFRGGSTDSQIRYLVRLGIQEETAMRWGKKQAGAVIDKLQNQTGPEYVMRFGKHMGQQLQQIPHEYLRWAGQKIEDQAFQENLEIYRQQVLAERKGV